MRFRVLPTYLLGEQELADQARRGDRVLVPRDIRCADASSLAHLNLDSTLLRQQRQRNDLMQIISFRRDGNDSYGLHQDGGIIDAGPRLEYPDLRAVLAASRLDAP